MVTFIVVIRGYAIYHKMMGPVGNALLIILISCHAFFIRLNSLYNEIK